MLKQLKVRTRLLLLLFISVFSMLAMSVMQVVNARFTQSSINSVYHGGVEDIYDLSHMHELIGFQFINTLHALQNSSLSWEEAAIEVDQIKEKYINTWKEYAKNPLSLNAELTALRQGLISQIDKGMKNTDKYFLKIKQIIMQKDQQKLNGFIQTDFFIMSEPIIKVLNELITVHLNDTKNDYLEAVKSASTLFTITVVVVCLALLFTIFLTIVIIRSIVKPLEYVVERVNRVADGDISIDIDAKSSGGELGSLLHAVSNMLMQMRKVIGDIKSEVNALSSSSQEILTSLSQLSSGAAETAAAVTETTTTVEELKQTAHLSADKAKDVLSSSDQTTHTVKSSEESVVTTIDDMKQIQDKMQIISDSILKLSEKGLAIAEIMNSVNDLAEQSNLLAVNAAIEAAKAGEQGRSFGVVAQEIRSLAEQSKQATVQVRSLLAEIQNATNAAVLATEQGSKAVIKGVTQSNETNKSIKALVENTSIAMQAANQIVLSSQQQLVGVEQVTTAMTNIDEATSQHVGQLDQIKSALGGLNQVSIALKQLTDLYKIKQ